MSRSSVQHAFCYTHPRSMRPARAPEIYGPRRWFATRTAADNFLRHVTRELTAGGLPHWIEAREQPTNGWLAIVHHSACNGGSECVCGWAANER